MTGAPEPVSVETDVLVIGSGAAGMYAAIEAARRGAQVLLVDRSLIGRGGATVMAQMTVAVALGEEVPGQPAGIIMPIPSPPAAGCATRRWPSCSARMRRTASASSMPGASAGRARMGTSPRPRRRATTGRAASMSISSIPGRRCRRRCARIWRAIPSIRKAGDLCIVDLAVGGGEVTGAVAYHLGSGAPVVIAAKATILATGGLTRLYRRNSASANMGGDGYALALRAGASLVDMEFVQFFPIGHLAPRLVGMDPIMWDPFRYKLGGRLLNGSKEEFTSKYGSDEDGKYVLTRDLATYAITKEVEAGRGSPHGGAYLSFEHCSAAALREAFGPVIDRLADNGIDLTKTAVEVAPIAHYHMGGVKADARMMSDRPGLYVAGEVVGGANGANRLSGNAITEALVFGRRAGRSAAAHAAQPQKLRPQDCRTALDLLARAGIRSRYAEHGSDDRAPAGHHGRRRRAVPHRRKTAPRVVRHCRAQGRAGRAAGGIGCRLRSAAARLVRSAQHDRRGAGGRAIRAQPRAKAAARISARIFPPCCRNGKCISRAKLARRHGAHLRRAGRGDGMSREAKSIATLKIWRGDARDAGRFESHDVPFEDGQSVLDGLRWLRVNKDPSLAVRYSCINANACKECMMQLDGETVYACTARLEPREMTLTPLPNKKLIRDLVTEIAPPSERFKS